MSGARLESAAALDTARPGRLRQRLSQIMVMIYIVDLVVLFLASMLAWHLRTQVDSLWETPAPAIYDTVQPDVAPWVILLWSLILLTMGAYEGRRLGAGFEELRALLVGSFIAICMTGFIGFLTKSDLSRGYLLLVFAIGTPVLLIVRYAERKTLHQLRRHGRLVNRVIAVGSPQAVGELIAVLDREPWTGYRVIGLCGPEGGLPGIPLLGDSADVRDAAVEQKVDGILVAGGTYSSAAELRRLGWAVEGLDLDLLVVPSLTDVAGPRVHFSNVAGLPLVHVREPQADEATGFAKRTFDLVVAGALLVVLSPVLLLASLAVRLQDGGPVFYRQRRVGRDGTEFSMLKFRSMVVHADQVRESLHESNEADGALFKIRDDPRVTRVGRFIRKYSIDELPQLFNVLAGEMSLVGPRPPLPAEVAAYESDVHRRLRVRPGMTGLWQVSGRSDLPWAEAVRLDLYYVDNWSMTGDVIIMLKTVRAVLFSTGAY